MLTKCEIANGPFKGSVLYIERHADQTILTLANIHIGEPLHRVHIHRMTDLGDRWIALHIDTPENNIFQPETPKEKQSVCIITGGPFDASTIRCNRLLPNPVMALSIRTDSPTADPRRDGFTLYQVAQPGFHFMFNAMTPHAKPPEPSVN